MLDFTFQSSDVVLVPQGAEYRAVCRGLKRAATLKPRVLPIPMGPKAVSQWVHQWAHTAYQPGLQILLMGLCGGLAPHFDVGDTVIIQDCLTTLHSVTQPLQRCNPQLNAWIRQKIQMTPVPARLLTTDRFVWSVQDKQALRQSYAADVVDMEGFSTLATFRSLYPEQSPSMAIIRVISDNAAGDLPNLTHAITPQGKLSLWSLVQSCQQRPRAALRFIQGSRRSLRVLQSITTQLFST